MGSAERIANVAKIVQSAVTDTEKPIVVVSAMSGVTNMLLKSAELATSEKGKAASEEWNKIVNQIRYNHIETGKELVTDGYVLKKTNQFLEESAEHLREFLEAISIIKELSPLSHDEVVSLGEKLSAFLLAARLESEGYPAQYVDLSEIVERKFNSVGSIFFDYVADELKSKVNPILEAGKIPVLTGFFGKIPGGIVDAVGRGYSDFTAALAGSAFDVEEIQIWTDVDGLLSADPRIIQPTCVLPEVSFEEACELAEFGAKVLHPQTIWPAVKRNVPVRIKNTLNPEAVGTLITKEGALGEHLCKSIAHKTGITAITLTSPRMLLAVGFLADVFAVFKKYDIAVDMVSTAEISVTATIDIDPDDIPEEFLDDLRGFCRVDILPRQAIVCAVGAEITERQGALAKIFDTVSEAGVSVRAISASAHKINISMVVDEKDAEKALFALHDKVFKVGI